MRIFILVTIAASIAAIVLHSPAKNRPDEYIVCKQTHPEGFCRLQFMPEQARASR